MGITQLTEPDPVEEVSLSDAEWRARFGITGPFLEAGVNELAEASIRHARLARFEARLTADAA